MGVKREAYRVFGVGFYIKEVLSLRVLRHCFWWCPVELSLDCILCILSQVLRTARLASSKADVQEAVLRVAMKRLLEEDWSGSPSELARRTGATGLIRELTGVGDPYRDYKRQSNDEALFMLDRVRRIVSAAGDPLMAAVKIAIAGNIIDPVTVDKYDLEKKIMEVLTGKPAVDDYNKLREDVLNSRTLLYFADNAGEIVFDKLLIEEMNKTRKQPFEKITFVVKGGPFANDATDEDALYVGINELPNIEIKTVSNGEPGTGPDPLSQEVLSWIRSHDLIIAKGQGNYEEYSHIRGIYFLLIVKCPVVARDLGANIGDTIIKKT
jgi:uncharacterized protein with ATP-grasp and redox domains